MKLYYSPGACSMGIHVILEEIGLPYDLQKLDLAKQEQYGPDFKAKNPKCKVPVLERDDGSILTEFPAIATWLAMTNPDSKLLPADPEGVARALEAMDYVGATIHMQGFGRFFRPARFAPTEADAEKVKAQGREMIEGGLKLMDAALAGKDWLARTFSVADTALFYVEFWCAARVGIELPPNCAAHYVRMKARPAVAKVMADEGLPA